MGGKGGGAGPGSGGGAGGVRKEEEQDGVSVHSPCKAPLSSAYSLSKITIKFHVPQGCEIPRLIGNLSSNLGLKAEDRVNSNRYLTMQGASLPRPPHKGHKGDSDIFFNLFIWADGFSINHGPLKRFEQNMEFLEAIYKGELPKDWEFLDSSFEVYCNIIEKVIPYDCANCGSKYYAQDTNSVVMT